jgi:SAM-dependent methyltransferase
MTVTTAFPIEHERTKFTHCPLCNANGVEYFSPREPTSVFPCVGHALWRKGLPPTMRWLSCQECGHEFTDGYFEGDAMRFLQGNANADQVLSASSERVEAERYIAADVLDRVLGWCDIAGSVPRSMLDVGFGSGALLTTAVEYGLEGFGCDTRWAAVEPMAKAGFAVECGEMPLWERTFDLVVLADVLEHVPFPGKMLEQARSLVRPHCWLFVSCPNIEAHAWHAIGERNPYLYELEHFHNFSRSRLGSLLEEHGFVVERYSASRRYRVGMELLARRQQ